MLTEWLNCMDKIKKDRSTEEKILDAARKVFVRDGMAGARMQDIADEAGMNKALLHYYFRNKEKLFETIFREITMGFMPRMNAIFESDMTLFEKIEAFCSEYITKIIENPFIPAFFFSELNKQPSEFLKKMWGDKKPIVGKMAFQIQEEARLGNIKPIHPLQLVMSMMALCVFPFLAKPLFQYITSIPDAQFSELMNERKKEVPRFIIDALKK